jgi:ABC-type lipoprotein export system ATPase subunit
MLCNSVVLVNSSEDAEESALTERVPSNCISDLTLNIEKREKVAICGSVGSGKTALLSSILGTVRLNDA